MFVSLYFPKRISTHNSNKIHLTNNLPAAETTHVLPRSLELFLRQMSQYFHLTFTNQFQTVLSLYINIQSNKSLIWAREVVASCKVLIKPPSFLNISLDSSVGVVSDYRQDAGIRSPEIQRHFPLLSVSRPALWPNKTPTQWVLGVLSPGVKGVTLTIHPIKCRGEEWVGATYSLSLGACMTRAGQLYFLYCFATSTIFEAGVCNLFVMSKKLLRVSHRI
jgi:hypothetical protein